MSSPTEQDLENLRTNLKRCSPATVEAAVKFRTTGDVGAVPAIVYGIIERHLAPENRRDLSKVSDDTRIIEDLGIDSLTMLEIVLSIEETVNISIENDELREIRTLGEVKAFIARKITDAPAPGSTAARKVRSYNRLDIGTRLPQQPPFLFLDEAEIDSNTVRARYTIKGDEAFLEGHFKGNPVMPASLVFEAVGQAACLWVLECAPAQLGIELKHNEVLFASMEEAHFYRRARPGDTVEMEVEMERLRAPMAVFRGRAMLRGERLAQIEHLMLAFGQDVVAHVDKQETDALTGDAVAGNGNGAAPKPKDLGDIVADSGVRSRATATTATDEPKRSLADDAAPAPDSPFADVTAPAKPTGDIER